MFLRAATWPDWIRNHHAEAHCLSMGGNEALAFRRSLQVHYCGWKTIELLPIRVLISSTTLCGRRSTANRCSGGQVGIRLRELVREVCRTNDIEILQGHVSADHVHILVSSPPNMSASKIMQYIKGKSSRKLMMEFRHLNKLFWGRHIWARGYFVATSGNVTDEVIQEYIRLQGPRASD